MAEQLSTLAIALGGDFNLHYQNQITNCVDLAELTRRRLNQNGRLKNCVADLVIVDRSYDPNAPLLHELTYQAMAYDVLRADGDIVTVGDRQLLLDETEDHTWADHRHLHMADVMSSLSDMYQHLMVKQEGMETSDGSCKQLTELMRRIPQFQKEIQELERHIAIFEDLDKNYDDWIDDLCDAEQDIACESTTQPIKAIIPWLLNKSLSDEMKMRLILLVAYNKRGIAEEKLTQLLQHSGIAKSKWSQVTNMRYFNATVVENDLPVLTRMPKRTHTEDIKYKDSRYVSRIRDLISYSLEGELDETIFTGNPSAKPQLRSARKRKIVVFVIGGVAPSEMRAAYELSGKSIKNSSSWFSPDDEVTSDVYIGASHIAQPHTQLELFNRT